MGGNNISPFFIEIIANIGTIHSNMETGLAWRERTRTERRKRIQDKHLAESELRLLTYSFTYLKPTSSTFNINNGWIKSRTTFQHLTLYVKKITSKKWQRVLETDSGEFYYLTTSYK